MPAVQCPIEGCDYVTADLDAAIVAALITAHCTTHAPGPVTAAKVEKVKRPVISSAGTSEEWAYFKSRWSDYVDATKITGRDKVVQLLECCDEQLRKDLTRSAGGSLTNKPENEVMEAIKKLAVREENTMVARVTLHNMRQDRDEPVRRFCARLIGQASVCKFLIKCSNCNNDVNYTDTIVRDVLARGICDPEIQLDLLGDKNQDMSLEEVSQFVEAKESGKRSASRLLDSHEVQAASSSYRKAKQTAVKDKQELCSYCGKKGHGKSASARVRKSECSAYGHKCGHCNRENHFENVCRSKDKPKKVTQSRAEYYENAVFNALCMVSAKPDSIPEKSLALDHHLYDNLSDTWIRRQSKSQPFINLNIRVTTEDYEAFGYRLSAGSHVVRIEAMADTGCQSCLAGIKVIHRLGLKQSDLIPVTMKMHAANNKGITILGATILRISGQDEHGNNVETRQMTYVTDNSDKLFVSREACIALGMISESFPTIGEIIDTQSQKLTPDNDDAIGSVSGLANACDCPKRQLPPPPPKELPYPANESNRIKLKEFLLDYYKSSTFNVCDHQPLPLMDGPPMRLMIDTDAEPVAHHTPVPVPLHWQEEVKAGLDQDVKWNWNLSLSGNPSHGVTGWWCVPRKMALLVVQWTFNLSMLTLQEKRTIHHHHFIRLDPYLTIKRKLSLMHGTDTTVCQFMRKIAI